jgi:hypothetical protein
MGGPDMNPMPRRILLSDQTATVLREGLEAGRWGGFLPSEAELCRELEISRVTLRRALEQLVRERRLEAGGRGRHHRICTKRTAQPAAAGRTLRVLAPYPLTALGSVSHEALVELGARIARLGYRMEFEHRPMLFKRHSPADLERLDALPETAGWLLLYSTEPMQRWFAARPRISLALGRVHEGVEVPCVYPDNKAAARHAAGMFHRRGRRDAVYIRERFTSLGDRVASEIFEEEMRRLGGRARVVVFDSKETTVEEVVERLLATQPRPTAIFTSSPETSLGVLCVLLRAQLRVPEEMALVAGWDDEFLGHTVPSIARYRVEGAALGRKLAQVLTDLFAHGPGKARALRVLPKFVPGGTLGA